MFPSCTVSSVRLLSSIIIPLGQSRTSLLFSFPFLQDLDFTAYPYIFSTERGWNAGMAGLPFIAVILGFFVSIVRRFPFCLSRSTV